MTGTTQAIIDQALRAAGEDGHTGELPDDPLTTYVITYLAVLASAAAQTTSQGYVRAGLPPVEIKEAEAPPPPTTLDGEL